MTGAISHLSKINHKKERQHLLRTAISTAAIALLFGYAFHKPIPSAILGTISLLSCLGFLFYRQAGRDIFLILSVIALALGQLVSWLALQIIYIFGILPFGIIGKLTGMDKLNKNFAECKKRKTMFENSPETSQESFRRQS